MLRRQQLQRRSGVRFRRDLRGVRISGPHLLREQRL
jgi:hypothetical protein